jgi:hypothetical protein
MKILFSTLLLFIGSVSFVGAQEHNHNDPNHKHTETTKDKKVKKKKEPITFKTTTIEYVNVPYGADTTFTFTFKNTGKEPIIVSNVQTSCGCTKAKSPEAPVAPKKSADIAVKFDTKRVGSHTKTITVTTNVSEPIVLTIKVTVLPENKAAEPRN